MLIRKFTIVLSNFAKYSAGRRIETQFYRKTVSTCLKHKTGQTTMIEVVQGPILFLTEIGENFLNNLREK